MGEMRKPEIAKQLARRSRLTQGEAADRLDVIIQTIVSDLRKGREPVLPGLGKFKHGADGQVTFEAEARKHHE
jgi:nucleoid DNA-binding protein